MSISKADVDGAETSKVGIDAAEACRVGVRVPPFYPEKPALWFAQMDAQFALANIKTDETKYFYVTGHLDPKYADVVEDIIAILRSPPRRRLSAALMMCLR